MNCHVVVNELFPFEFIFYVVLNVFVTDSRPIGPKGSIGLKDSGTFSKCPQIYIKLTGFEDNDSGKLPFKYY